MERDQPERHTEDISLEPATLVIGGLSVEVTAVRLQVRHDDPDEYRSIVSALASATGGRGGVRLGIEPLPGPDDRPDYGDFEGITLPLNPDYYSMATDARTGKVVPVVKQEHFSRCDDDLGGRVFSSLTGGYRQRAFFARLLEKYVVRNPEDRTITGFQALMLDDMLKKQDDLLMIRGMGPASMRMLQRLRDSLLEKPD